MKLSDLIEEETVTGNINVGGNAPNPPLGKVQRRYSGDVLSKNPKAISHQTSEDLKASLKEMVSSKALEFIGLFKNKLNKKGE